MDQEIDSLSLKIGVDINKDELKNLSKFATVITRLKNSIANLDLKKLNEIKVPKGIKNFNIVSQSFKNIEKQTVENTKQLNIGSEIQKATTYVSKMKTLNTESLKMTDTTKKMKEQYKDFGSLVEKFLSMGGKKKKNPLEKALGKVKLVAAVKAIRGAINFLVGGLNQGITNLAGFDKEFNSTVSGIKTSLSQTFNSLALIARPLIEAIQPVLQSMSTAVANIGNEASKIQASLKGQSTYTKINANYAEDYAKSMQKASAFSFDTFNTLNSQTSPYETADLEEGDVDSAELEDTKTFIEGIHSLISGIGKLLGGVFSVVVQIVDYLKPSLGIIFDVVGEIADLVGDVLHDIMDALAPVLDYIGEVLATIFKGIKAILNAILPQIRVVVKLVTDVLAILSDIIGLRWDKVFDHLKQLAVDYIKGVARMLDAMLNGVLDFINDFLFSGLNLIGEKVGWQKIGIFFGRSNLESLVPSFENGGLVGELWQMNEHGVPEMLYNANNSSNNTSVINQAQLSQAFETAIYNTGLIPAIQSAGVVSIDGRDIASSSRFIQEMNRRNKTNFR